MDWWMTFGDREPLGPFRTEDLLSRIEAGTVPKDALICEVGRSIWVKIIKVAPFSSLLAEQDGHHVGAGIEQTPVEPADEDPLQVGFYDEGESEEEPTQVDRVPGWASAPLRKSS